MKTLIFQYSGFFLIELDNKLKNSLLSFKIKSLISVRKKEEHFAEIFSVKQISVANIQYRKKENLSSKNDTSIFI